jgi:hypothetical protein
MHVHFILKEGRYTINVIEWSQMVQHHENRDTQIQILAPLFISSMICQVMLGSDIGVKGCHTTQDCIRDPKYTRLCRIAWSLGMLYSVEQYIKILHLKRLFLL